MSNKYYTPKLWELCHNFDVEIWNDLEKVWNKHKINIGNSDVEWIVQDFIENIRVKHLDREDIESLGFVHDPDYGYAKIYQKEGCDIFTQNGSYLKIHATNGNYEGVIRNKFHLQQILNDIM